MKKSKSRSKKVAKRETRPGTFQPGNQVGIGNSNSSRQHRVLTQTLISMLNEVDGTTMKGKGRLYALCDKLYRRAMKGDGDLEAIKFIFDRVDGKLIQPVSMQDDDGQPYEFTLRIGQRAPDGTESAAEVRLHPPVAVPEAVDGDIQPPRRNGKAGSVQSH